MLGNKKNILYVSNVCDDKVFNFVLENSIVKPSQAAQKFQKLLLEGFVLNDAEVTALSILPVDSGTIKQKIFYINNIIANKIYYKYLPILNVIFLKDILIFAFTLINFIKWSICEKNKLVINNVLNLTVSISSLILSKIFRVKCIAIVTDLPIYMGSNMGQDKIKIKIYKKIASFFMLKYDGYILLTEQMNEVVNKNYKPFIIMEGMVDFNIELSEHNGTCKFFEQKPKIIYAGSLHYKYGLMNLVNAFIKLNNPNIELHIYGSGDLESELIEISATNLNVKYFGVVENRYVTKELESALVLINPRPVNGDYTKFSFPSKNIEYMVSGRPLITTKLPGIPKEYYPFVYLLEGDSEIDIYQMLIKIINCTNDELTSLGQTAKQFVLENKSNKNQTRRILEFAKSI